MAKLKTKQRAKGRADSNRVARSAPAKNERATKARSQRSSRSGSNGAAAARASARTRRERTKQAHVIQLLKREDGASLAELTAETGWLPHTVRAALTRLRQGGYTLDKSKDTAGRTVYRIDAAHSGAADNSAA